MLHNLSIAVTGSMMLSIVWNEERRHTAYWELVAWMDGVEEPLRLIDGPFPHPREAAHDFYARASSLPWIVFRDAQGKTIDPRTTWEAAYGINFSLAMGVNPGEDGYDGCVFHRVFMEKPPYDFGSVN